MDVCYRDGSAEDAAGVAAVFRESFIDTFAHLYRPEDLAAFLDGFREEDWRGELEHPDFTVRVAEADGKVVAFANVGPLRLPIEPARPSVELRQLYVLGSWHGSGIARELMDWVIAEARARDARDLYLSVYVDNHRARRFYARYGFEYVGTYDFMVGDHADEDHIMRLPLEAVHAG